MASFNTAHHEGSGGVILFSGELILLFCDDVNMTIDGKGNVSGRMYLTTHRVIFTAQPLTQNSSLKSFSAPFYAMFDLSLEQPVFGANYIKGKVRSESSPDSSNGVTFKLKFTHGGAIEFGQAMDNAAKMAKRMASQMQFTPPPAYSMNWDDCYQASPNVYQPAYNCGFALPTNVFSTPPPAGFVYAMEAPPPYPGLNTAPQAYGAYPQAFPAYGASGPAYSAPMTTPAYGAPMAGTTFGAPMAGATFGAPMTGPAFVAPMTAPPYGTPMAAPAYGTPMTGPSHGGYQNGVPSAPYAGYGPPPGVGFMATAGGTERPPTYDEATKKIQ